jgi:hypothetical protein
MNAISACPSEMWAGCCGGVVACGAVSDMLHHVANDVISTMACCSAADGSAAIDENCRRYSWAFLERHLDFGNISLKKKALPKARRGKMLNAPVFEQSGGIEQSSTFSDFHIFGCFDLESC